MPSEQNRFVQQVLHSRISRQRLLLRSFTASHLHRQAAPDCCKESGSSTAVPFTEVSHEGRQPDARGTAAAAPLFGASQGGEHQSAAQGEAAATFIVALDRSRKKKLSHPLGSMSTMLGIISRVVFFLPARVASICSAQLIIV